MIDPRLILDIIEELECDKGDIRALYMFLSYMSKYYQGLEVSDNIIATHLNWNLGRIKKTQKQLDEFLTAYYRGKELLEEASICR